MTSRPCAAVVAVVASLTLVLGARDAAATPAAALVMPFDATASAVSFLVASHPASGTLDAGVRTHWSFWDETCTPLADAILCLAGDGSVIVDPTQVPATTGVADLSGRRGFVTVTAYEAGEACDPADAGRGTIARTALLGSFTLADVAAGVSFGGAAIALTADPGGAFVDFGAPGDGASDTHQAALRLQSFDPADLDVSRVILLALREGGGSGAFRAAEPGPAVTGDALVRAGVRFTDRDGASVALPDANLGCATFTSLRRDDTPTLLVPGGPGDAVASSGMLSLDNPRIGDQALGRTTWLVGFHGQGVGSFGVLAVGDATLAARTQPTPGPSPGGATATPRATATTTPRPGLTPTPRPTTAGSPTPGGSPTPRPTGSVVAPTTTAVITPGGGPPPSPSATSTSGPAPTTTASQPTPGATRTPPGPTPTRTPSRTPTPHPSATAPPTPRPTATSAPSASPPTATPPGCSTRTVQVRTTYGAGAPGDVSGVIATLAYPATVSIPGTGSDVSVTSRVSNVSGVNGLFQATDADTQIRAGLVSVAAAIPAGPFVRIVFDCVSDAAPPASAFGCTLEASTLGGALVPGAACSTEVVP